MRKFDVSALESQLFDREFAARADSRELQVLSNLWRALLRAKFLIILATIIGATLAFVYSQSLERRYTAASQVMIDTRIQRERALPTAEAVLPTTTTALESELEVLGSFDLVERVVDVLGLEDDPEFGAEGGNAGLRDTVRGVIGQVRDWTGLSAASSEAPADEEDDAARERLIETVAARRSVSLASNLSAVYSISFTSRDRRKAALIANTFGEQYLELQMAAKRDQLNRAHDWLSSRASDLNRQLAELARQSENHALRTPFSSAQSLQEAQNLRDTYNQQLDRARAQGATARVQDLEAAIERLNRQLADHAAHEAEAARIANEVTVAESVYSRVVGQLSDLHEQGDILRPDAQIITQARPPLAPSEPRVPFLVASGGAAGAFLVMGIVLMRELGQGRLRSLRDFEEATNLPILGFLPRTRRSAVPLQTILAGRMPDQRLVKSIRKLRASLAASRTPHQIIASASSLPGEGKSSTLLMLAHAYAQAGEKTLLIDLDIWRSPFRSRLSSATGVDLMTLLGDPDSFEQHVVALPNQPLSIFTAPKDSEFPPELQNPQSLEGLLGVLRKRYDRILIDLPPVLPVLDVAPVAAAADITLFVVRWNATPRSAVVSALRSLRDVGVVPVGVIASIVAGERAHAYADDDFSYAHRRYLSGY